MTKAGAAPQRIAPVDHEQRGSSMRNTRRAFALGVLPAALVARGELRNAAAKDIGLVAVADPGLAAKYDPPRGSTPDVIDDRPVIQAPHLGGGKHQHKGGKDDPTPPPTGEPTPQPPPGPGDFCGACQTDADCIDEGLVCGAVDGVCGPPDRLCAGKFWDCFNHRTLVCPEDGSEPHCRLGRHDVRRRKGRLAHRDAAYSYCFGTGDVCIPVKQCEALGWLS
jgi:hypothetical protein